MINQEYIMLIMNCQKYQKKAKFQKMTWLQKIPSYIRYYHVIGDPDLQDTKYKFDNENNILWVKVEDDYNSLPKKVIASYQAIYETFNFKYVFKTDDDQVLVNPTFFNTLVEFITKKSRKSHYGGFIVDVQKPHISEYYKIHPELPTNLPIYVTQYCSGRFYFLSKQAVIYLLSKRELIEKEYLEDYAIGFHLNQIYKNDIIPLATNKFFTDIELSDFPQLLKEGKI
jgi:hypothetical protein